MKTKKVTVIGSEKPVEITFKAIDTKDIKEELVCDKFCPIKNICEKLIDPDCINHPIYSFNDFCLRVGELYTKPLDWNDIAKVKEHYEKVLQTQEKNERLSTMPDFPKREIGVELIPEITEEEAINLIGLKGV